MHVVWFGFGNYEYLVSAYKNPPAQPIPPDEEKLNTRLAKGRITTDHTIGILKGGFPWLKEIPMRITNEKKSIARILRYIDCCIILHDVLIAKNDTDEEQPWINEEDISDIDDEKWALTAYNMSHMPLKLGCTKDERRSRLKVYLDFKECAWKSCIHKYLIKSSIFNIQHMISI